MAKDTPRGTTSADREAAIAAAMRKIASSGLKQRFARESNIEAYEAEKAMANGDFARGRKDSELSDADAAVEAIKELQRKLSEGLTAKTSTAHFANKGLVYSGNLYRISLYEEGIHASEVASKYSWIEFPELKKVDWQLPYYKSLSEEYSESEYEQHLNAEGLEIHIVSDDEYRSGNKRRLINRNRKR